MMQQKVTRRHSYTISILTYVRRKINTINPPANPGASMFWNNVRIAQLFGLLVGNCNNA